MRAPQPSGTNRPSSSLTPRSPPGRDPSVRHLAVRPSGHAEAVPGGRNAAHRSAALAAGARPVPFRTRKLSRPAPMVLRGKPVGEQGAADRWTAFHRGEGPGGEIPRGPFPFFWPRESWGQAPNSHCQLCASCSGHRGFLSAAFAMGYLRVRGSMASLCCAV